MESTGTRAVGLSRCRISCAPIWPLGSRIGFMSLITPTRKPPVAHLVADDQVRAVGDVDLQLLGRHERQPGVGVVGQEHRDDRDQHRDRADQHRVGERRSPVGDRRRRPPACDRRVARLLGRTAAVRSRARRRGRMRPAPRPNRRVPTAAARASARRTRRRARRPGGMRPRASSKSPRASANTPPYAAAVPCPSSSARR